ncbi:class I heat shock protein-like [Macadamia integrifolia]|uniref:class I heat shock protein-like n=1 Tax=Macadamia integrifolia TaxID=60698 RepID=UPI001C4F5927|nr:class I heat shock protein-like [Macadamia integrifolia]
MSLTTTSFFGWKTTINDELDDLETTVFSNARIDWKESSDAFIFIVETPGLKKEEVKVEIAEGKVLKISGERKKEFKEKNENWHRVKRSSGKFLRSFRLPENASVDQTISMENGIFTVTVPKVDWKKTSPRLVDISG